MSARKPNASHSRLEQFKIQVTFAGDPSRSIGQRYNEHDTALNCDVVAEPLDLEAIQMGSWTKLPAWIRYPVSLGLIGVGIAIFCFADPVPLGLIGTLVGVGFALLMIGPSDADKNGYHF